MKNGDIYNIYDIGGNYTYYAKFNTDTCLSIYTENDDLVYTSGVAIGGEFYIYNDTFRAVFRAIIKDDRTFEMYSTEDSELLYTASLK